VGTVQISFWHQLFQSQFLTDDEVIATVFQFVVSSESVIDETESATFAFAGILLRRKILDMRRRNTKKFLQERHFTDRGQSHRKSWCNWKKTSMFGYRLSFGRFHSSKHPSRFNFCCASSGTPVIRLPGKRTVLSIPVVVMPVSENCCEMTEKDERQQKARTYTEG
jgi:hypothetical protein